MNTAASSPTANATATPAATVSPAAPPRAASAPAGASTPAPAANPLLTAPILPTLLRLALPNMVAMLATALAAMAETGFVSRLGVASLAGMALVFPMVMLQQMLSAGAMGGGVSSAVSRALGAGDLARANTLAVHATWIGLGVGASATALMLLFGPAVYALLGGRGEALAQAAAYSNVAFLGSVGVWLMNTFASVLRGCGNMRVPSATLLVAAVTQVAVGGLFGLGSEALGLPGHGMAGVALGQVVAYGGGALFLFGYLRSGRARLKLSVATTRLQRDMLKDILRVGALACLSPLQTVATILVLTGLVARFGTDALAGYGIGTRLEFLLVPIAFAVGVASVPLVGMAIGAAQVARARRVAWQAAAVTFTGLGLLGLLVALRPALWTGLFTQDAAVLASAASYFHWAGPGYGLFGLGLCLYFSSLGAGHAGGPVLAGTLRLVVVAAGGWLLAQAQAPAWTIFALAGCGMAAYGLAMMLAVGRADWTPRR